MSETADDVQVVDNPGRCRFELWVGEAPAGRAEYGLRPGRLVVDHTEVADAYQGRGLASRLARETLDAVRERGLRVTPECRYVAGYIRRHPEYVDLVDDEHRAEFTGSEAG